MDLFGWNLYEIDQTDIESLIPFVMRYPRWKAQHKASNGRQEVFVDEVDWL